MSDLLAGGRRRRRLRTRVGLIALILVPIGVAAAAVYLTVIRDDESRGGAVPLATGTPPGTPASRSRSPVLQADPVPDVRVSGVDAFRFAFRKPPRAALLFDVRTGEALWSRKARARLPIASLTKIMTAVLVTQRAAPGERVMITREALRYQGSGVGVLPKGRRVRFEALLNGLLILSGNDAAIALAVHVAGSQRRFVRLMNRTARRLGLRCTRFMDSHGLAPGNRSCARDLAVMTRLAMGNRRITRVARRRQVSIPFPIKGRRIFLSTHNPLFRSKYPGAIGLKTGFTDEAGRCFVGVARRGRRTLGVVLLDSPSPPKHAPALLDQGFRNG
jgi:serine-type D-Ala-D-Ala carboxypeptidase (penicillin-binding protein 5/6)